MLAKNSIFFAVTMSILLCFPPKFAIADEEEVEETAAEAAREEKIECVNNCGDTFEEWQICAPTCYDKMDESDKAFISCEKSCLDKYYPGPAGVVADPKLEDLEKCAQNCIETYRGF